MPSELFIDDADRYAGLRLIHWWDQSRLARAKILVVGAGAIGNEVLKNLALVGIGQVIVIDCDRIESSNLTRSVLFRASDFGKSKAAAAAAAMRDLNADVSVRAIHGNVITDVGLGVFRDVDLVIGAVDNREARLWINRACWKVGTPWIDGGIQEISGVVKVFAPPNGACYECGMTDNDYRLLHVRYSCPLLSREDLQSGKVPTAPTVASIIGGLQVQEALKLLHELPVESGHAHVYNGEATRLYTTSLPRRQQCLSHESYGEPVELSLRADESTVHQLFTMAASRFEDEPLTLALDRDLVTSVDCSCGFSNPLMQPRERVSAAHSACPRCGGQARASFVHQIESSSPLADRRLCELGIPPYDILRLTTPNQAQVFLMAGDRQRMMNGNC